MRHTQAHRRRAGKGSEGCQQRGQHGENLLESADGLHPTLRYRFAIYKRGDTMVLVAAPRKSYVTIGYTNDPGLDAEPLEFASAEAIDEAKVAEMVTRLLASPHGPSRL